ncbi:hypothetical protein [Thermosulfidibacter takaii]|nr:hypothetical protein [Thermosulfidibacter takaii]
MVEDREGEEAWVEVDAVASERVVLGVTVFVPTVGTRFLMKEGFLVEP